MKSAPSKLLWILSATAIAGSLDIGLASILALGRGRSIEQMFQSIASGVLGKDSYALGTSSAWFGVALHYFIIFVMAAVGFGVFTRLNMVRRHLPVSTALYGILLCLIMERVVVPLSSAPFHMPWSAWGLLTSLFSHVFLVAAPIAVLASKAYSATAGNRLHN